MIAFVRGTVIATSSDRIVVDLGSVGITVHTTPGVVSNTSAGSEIFLHTSMVVREDGWTLYGFAESAECAVFEKVQTVSGIGPRLAAAILAVMGADGLVEAIATEITDPPMEALLDLVKDIWDFLKVRKKYWLAPLIITLVLMGALIVFTQGSVVAPFIYSIF